MIIPCIDTPLADVSDFYKHILTIACQRPPQVIKKRLDIKSKVKNISISQNHIMTSLDVVCLFPTVPKELVYKSIKKRWNDIHTVVPRYTRFPYTRITLIRGLSNVRQPLSAEKSVAMFTVYVQNFFIVLN